MTKLGKLTPEEIIKSITDIEETIIEHSVRETRSHKRTYENTRREEESNNYKNLYCKKHGTCRHTTVECRSLLKNQVKDNKHKSNENNLLVLRDKGPQIGGIELRGEMNQTEITFLIDPGATKSYISEKMVSKLKLDIIKLEKIEKTQIASGNTCEIKEKTVQTFKITVIPSIEYCENFFVIEGDLPYILLGEPFLIKQGVIIDYKAGNIQISNHTVFLDSNYKEWSKTPDTTLIEKAYSAKTTYKKESCESIMRLIQTYKFVNPNLGKIPNITMKIKLMKEDPIFRKPYSIPIQLIEPMKMEIKRLLNLNIIRESNSPFCFPAFPIMKRNGEMRLVVDFRKLNEVTIKDANPFPNLWEELRSIPESQVFSQIDLMMGYHQIMLEEESIKYVSFSTSFGQFEYLRVPFGLANAPRVFQRTIYKILGHLRFVRIFLDDILIFSNDINEHLNHMEEVLKILENNNISINFNKSNFCKEEVTYLGHKISKEGLTPVVNHLPSLNSLMPAKNLKEVRSICGYLNWFRPYLKNLSHKIKPITDLTTKKKRKIVWLPLHTKIIEQIMEEIKSNIFLKFPDYLNSFYLDTDASENAMGAVLYQKHGIIGMYSKKFTPAQSRYTVTEKELFAIYSALNFFKKIIFLSKVIINTDHANLTFNTNPTTNRWQRWKLALSEFDCNIRHKKGVENNVADVLSRCLVVANNQSELEKQNEDKIKLSNEEELKLIKKTHDKLAHPGINAIYYALKDYYQIKKLRRKIEHFKLSCTHCQRFYTTTYKYGKVSGTIMTSEAFKHISSDIYGPIDSEYFEEGLITKKYILTITDRCTRWSRAYLMKEITSKKIQTCFLKWMKENPKPASVLTDMGRQYISNEMKNFWNLNQIQHNLTSAYNPTGNAISERINKTITRVLQANIRKPLRKVIKTINFVLQNQTHKTLKASPHELRFGFSNFDTLRRINERSIEKINEYQDIEKKKNCDKTNKKRIDRKWNIGEKVFIRTPTKKKLEPKWEGPYVIFEIASEGNVVKVGNQEKRIQVNIKRLRPLERKRSVRE
ncbi:MAG: reverse transcriptase domain-containing protein [Longicatena sp.]